MWARKLSDRTAYSRHWSNVGYWHRNGSRVGLCWSEGVCDGKRRARSARSRSGNQRRVTSTTIGWIRTQGVLCDLNSLASVKRFAQKFVQNNAPLHVLILNAGIFQAKYGQTADGLEQDMGVNHIAHAYLTQLLMPKLIRSAPSRIVILSSDLHSGPAINYRALEAMSTKANDAKKGWSMRGAYQQSKLANPLFARAIASRYGNQQVTAYSLHPGVIDTNLTADLPLAGLFKMILKKKTVPQGAATTVFCALKPGLERETGRYFTDSTVTDRADKWSDDQANTLWNWTQKMIQERTRNL